jgi:DNA-binding transcriptional regulator YiaG
MSGYYNLMKTPRNKPARRGTKNDIKRLKRLREILAMSQRDLASEWYCSVGAVTHWETGIRPIPGPVLKLLEIYEDKTKLK